jgi:hypothetical protein
MYSIQQYEEAFILYQKDLEAFETHLRAKKEKSLISREEAALLADAYKDLARLPQIATVRKQHEGTGVVQQEQLRLVRTLRGVFQVKRQSIL